MPSHGMDKAEEEAKPMTTADFPTYLLKYLGHNIVQEQQPPQDSAGDMWNAVIHDMEQRRLMGIERYGKPVQPFNGRDPLVDAYQEALDLVVYLRQAIAERAAEDGT